MLKKLKYKIHLLFILLLTVSRSDALAEGMDCNGKLTTPADACWSCLFPIRIGGVELPDPGSDPDNNDPAPPTICFCQRGSLPMVPGVSFSLWEPARIAEVVRKPMCSPTLSAQLGTLPVPRGTNANEAGNDKSAFYHVHWFKYPLLAFVDLFTSIACLQRDTFDIAYMTEFDIMWDDDILSMIMNPEAFIFANPIAMLACVADTVKAVATNFGINSLFWCAGSQGNVFPTAGTIDGHVGGIDSSLCVAHRALYKFHRTGFAQDTTKMDPMCQPLLTFMLKKTQYKTQMVFPRPQVLRAFGLGVPSTIWGIGREFPYKGEDFAYIFWRKRLCCIL